VIKLSALGDLVLALPAFARIRTAHPSARITCLTTAPYEALARASPFFDEVWSDGRPESPMALARLIGRLRRRRFDRIYDLQGVDRTNLYFQLLRPAPPSWSGVAFGCDLPHRNRLRMRMHTLERQAEQLNDAGLTPPEPTSPGAASPADVAWLAALAGPLATIGPRTALLVPGASPRRPRKRWPTGAFAELARRLAAEGFDVAILGAAAEGDIARTIAAAVPGAHDLVGCTDLAQLARLGQSASLAVGNDTGPMHLIAAAGAPTLSLFSGDSDPDLCAPRGRVRVLRREDLADLDADTVASAAMAMASPCDAATP
jgi:ADP-heptose:LPS heptosyltransferase